MYYNHRTVLSSLDSSMKLILHKYINKQLGGYSSTFVPDALKSHEIFAHKIYFQLFCNGGNFTTGTAIKEKTMFICL